MEQPEQVREKRRAQDWGLLIWDLAIIFLVGLNLSLILVDSVFVIGPINNVVQGQWPDFYQWYDDNIHKNFQQIDLYFVAVFLLDVASGWVYAIVHRSYQRWWFYPFARWYDVLGCIPLSGFRLLRVLRVLAILLRLQRMGLINIRNWRVFALLKRYYDIVLEEVSDRVVENVLTGIQNEVRGGASTLPAKIVDDVILPRREALSRSIARSMGGTYQNVYQDNKDDLEKYLTQLVAKSVQQNAAVKQLERVPGIGDAIVDGIARSLSGSSLGLMEEMINSLDSPEFEKVIDDVLGSLLGDVADKPPQSSHEVGDVMVEIIEVIKVQVRKRRWLDEI